MPPPPRLASGAHGPTTETQLPESYKRKREEMMARIPEDERKVREFFGVDEDGSESGGADDAKGGGGDTGESCE